MAHKQESVRFLAVSSLCWLLIIQSMFPCLHSMSSKDRESNSNCIGSEREALVTFKLGLTDPGNILSSWEGDECCLWWGVACNNKTSHVVELNLRRTEDNLYNNHTSLAGKISPSLLHLKHLQRLDLSFNNFSGTSIPKFIGSFQNLRYLNLSSTNFVGLVPPHLGNLSRLLYLDLNQENTDLKLHVDNLNWLPRLSSLKYLDMSNVKLTVDWFQAVNMLPSLTALILEGCELDFIPSSSLPYLNLTSLKTLDLQANNFNSSLPSWLWNVSSLTHLDLLRNSFHGPIPDAVGNLLSLEFLQLDQNYLDGTIPKTITNLCRLNTLSLSYNNIRGNIAVLVDRLWNCSDHKLQLLRLSHNQLGGKLTSGIEQMRYLEVLDLSDNQFDGPIPVEIGKLSQLLGINLFNNSFNGLVSEAHFANLTNLMFLELSMNSLTISLDETWDPPFQLETIGLGSCHVGPLFPSWIEHQVEVSALFLYKSGISGAVPEWFWRKVAPSITFLDLSSNQISGMLPSSLEFAKPSTIYLSSNQFEGPLPPGLLSNSRTLDLSNNSFSGPLPNTKVPFLDALLLSNNHFNSSIPSSLCKVIGVLDLSNNDLSGEIPDKWGIQPPEIINFANNQLSGRIPNSLGFVNRALILRNNNLSGFFPTSLKTSKFLTYLDLSQNYFYGSIPTWLGENITILSFLSLRSNLFSGNIPLELTQLYRLKVLDLADNNLSGSIPHCLGNFSAMASVKEQDVSDDLYDDSYIEEDLIGYYIDWLAFTKAVELHYTKNLYLFRSIDLSGNYLRGEIPEVIGALIGLTNLDLSRNLLKGNIPEAIGRMQSLESLDLSSNELSGSIPLSISDLNSLSYLNLSYNNLSGRIPSGPQLQTLIDPSIYAGNDDLCGPPLTKNCSSNKKFEGSIGTEGGDELIWICYSIGLGYIVGVWVVCGVLLFKKTWRYAYFQLSDNMQDKLYVAVSLTLARWKRATSEDR